MRRALIFLGLFCVLALIPGVGRAQLSDEAKRDLFLRAREDIRPVPRSEPEPTPKPKPKSVATPKPTPTPKPKPTPEEEEEKPAKRPTPEPEDEPTPRPKSTPQPAPDDEEKPAKPAPAKAADDEPAKPSKDDAKPAKDNAKPSKDDDVIPLEDAASTPTPKPTPTPKASKKTTPEDALKAPIVIEKSGLEEDQGYEPASKSTGGWFRRWRYLSPNVRKAIDQAKVKKGRWKYIIVHNSGTRQGNARIFNTYHLKTRKMQNGLAYHFVIGNGSSSGNGEIEIGPRWTKQINGGHVASDYLNNIAIGVCFVGDFNRDTPTKAQIGALDELIVYLRGRVGKIKGKPAIVVPHKKINPKPTDCPGNKFPYSWLQQKFGS
jgi:hypothetical protein